MPSGFVDILLALGLLMAGWFMLSAAAYGIATEFELREPIRSRRWFHPLRFLAPTAYTEPGQHFRKAAIANFIRAIVAWVIVVGAFFATRGAAG